MPFHNMFLNVFHFYKALCLASHSHHQAVWQYVIITAHCVLCESHGGIMSPLPPGNHEEQYTGQIMCV